MNRSLSVDDNRRPTFFFQFTEIEIVGAAENSLLPLPNVFFEKSPAGDLRAASEQRGGKSVDDEMEV